MNESRIYGKREFAGLVNRGVFSLMHFGKQRKLISKDFETNLMLAVTQVNGCQVCNYYHTKHAIDSGMSDEDLKTLLDGEFKDFDEHQATALIFAQHYASEKEKYSEETYQSVVEHYGEEEAQGILGILMLISMGNAHGINAGNFKSRFTKAGKIPGSKLFNELFIILSPLLLLPVFLIGNIFSRKIK